MNPFDVEAEAADDVTQQFWGSSRGWVSEPHQTINHAASADQFDDSVSDTTTGSLRAFRNGVLAFRPRRTTRADHSGQVERTRQHGVVSQRQAPALRRPAAREASLGELADGWNNEIFDTSFSIDQPTQRLAAVAADDELVPLSPVQPLADRIGLSAVDPLLARIGMLILVALMLVPIALAVRPNSDQALAGALAAGVVADVATLADVANASAPEPSLPAAFDSSSADLIEVLAAEPVAAPNSVVATEAANQAPDLAPTSETLRAPAVVGDSTQVATSSVGNAATVSATAERSVPACPTTYVAGAGDSWYRIADAAGVTPNALLEENRATVHTVIFPGDEICLPAGATMPTPPPATTVESTTTQPPVTTAPATTAPATTQPPTTTPASASEVQQIIRDIWPDELEEKALQIAWRESNYIPTAFNGSCCYGLFQIYWTVHAGWLDDYGIYSSADLLDARKNATAAYALYQRAGGWGPWGG